ncbi:MAG: 2-isopropylmalate synthase [Spirochaetaceae bacterium]|jgi:2-isopropylmalate synthase|nr:2-isopropylmalate synthase [Spirochaetaceae bacterium]
MSDGKRIIRIFDTTLRDGEQAPGCSMNVQEKLEVARKLESLGVDVIEAGFPASSPGDLESVSLIAGIIKNSSVAALCRCVESDIEAGKKALKLAAHPRIHLFLATSSIHLEYKLKMTPEQMLKTAVASVKLARSFCDDVEFSAEDASRSDPDFVAKVFSAVIEAGATTVNFPDTTGYAMPDEYAKLVNYVKTHTIGMEKAAFSVHVHNDLGLATANSLAAIGAGADQVECTINGIGERAGNTSLEEVVMALKVRASYWGADTKIDTTQLYPASRLVSKVTGVKVQPNKAVVGENAFAHEAGIHQHGVLANRATYEIMSPESVGIAQNMMVLGKHSGRHALEDRLKTLGYTTLDQKMLDSVFSQFKALADKKKVVSDKDIEALVQGATVTTPETWKLDRWLTNASSNESAISAVRLEDARGGLRETVHFGNGCIDAAFSAINDIIGKDVRMESFELGSISGESDAQGEALVKVKWTDCSGKERVWNGRGVSTNIVESAIKAYIQAINAIEAETSACNKNPEFAPLSC